MSLLPGCGNFAASMRSLRFLVIEPKARNAVALMAHPEPLEAGDVKQHRRDDPSTPGGTRGPRMPPGRASTRHPERLATPRALLDLTRALAVLDEVFWPEWDERYYSFEKERGGTCLARMRNGEGDLWYLLFLPNGAAVLRGFDHESSMNPYRGDDEKPWPGLFEGMPRTLQPWKHAADIEPGEVTFVMWHATRGPWRTGPIAFPPGKDPDGSEWLLEQLDGDPASYVRLAEARLERPIDRDAVRAVYAGALDGPTVGKLNPLADVTAVLKSARQMGLPMRKGLTTKKKLSTPTQPAPERRPLKERRAPPPGPAEGTAGTSRRDRPRASPPRAR